MTMQPARVRLDARVPQHIYYEGPEWPPFEVVDLVDGDDGWTNSEDTLVLRFPRSDEMNRLWAELALRHASETDRREEGDDVFLRFRWDLA